MQKEKLTWDAIIVGAGAAGLMAAITAGRRGLCVLVLDGKEKIGAKILMSGGTRCNITNQNVNEKDFESETPLTLRNILRSFSSERALQFFKEIGVDIILEDGGKFFPSTHSGRTVLDALLKETKRLGILSLETSKKVKSAKYHDSYFEVSGDSFSYQAKQLVLCTGGLSYPSSGSDGVGYVIAKLFGHHLIETSPALTPLTTPDADWKSLSGLSLPVLLTFFSTGKKETSYEGSFLFTHFGFSGPAVLNISRYWIRASGNKRIEANVLPHEDENKLREQFKDVKEKRAIKNILNKLLPGRFAEVVLSKLKIPVNLKPNQMSREVRENLLQFLFHYELPVDGAIGYAKAEVTAGGIDLCEVNTKTLESKLRPGLFFAGEILDVDGRIGGFNFQWAWSSGFVVGSNLAGK